MVSSGPADLNHEIVMVLKDDKGIVIFSGCSHRGILNVMESINEEFKIPVKAVFGGFHLMGRPSSGMVEEKEDIIFTAEKLSLYKIERIYTCIYNIYSNKITFTINFHNYKDGFNDKRSKRNL